MPGRRALALRLRSRMLARAVRASGWRAALAIVAVGLGIAATTVTLALAAGADREMAAIADQIGRNLFSVTAGQVRARPGTGSGWFVSRRLTLDDAAAVGQRLAEVAAVVPILEGSRRVEYGRNDLVTTVRGVTPDYLDLRRFQVAAGRPFDARDAAARDRVALLGPAVAARLAGGAPLVGETVWLGGVPFSVIGELREKGMSADGQNEDDQILVPFETARLRVFNVDWLSRLLVRARDDASMTAAQRGTRDLLRRNHRLADDVADDFEVLPLVRTNVIRRTSSAFLNGMARLFTALTLGVGGAGVLAVAVLNVKDRAWEIALRMAVGARRRDIAALFLAEAAILGAAGGVAGLAAGWLAVLALERALGWVLAIDLRGVAAPFALALVLGLIFGVVPAIKAARVLPVVGLRGG